MHISIENTVLSSSGPAMIIAEMSANHAQDLAIARDTIAAARDAGANAIKLQSYTADTITLNCGNDHFKIRHGTLWDGQTLYDLYDKAHMPWEWHEELFEYARSLGLTIFSSPFDTTAVDLLESLNTPAYKIASPEITDIPLIAYAAAKHKPMLISTGMAEEKDIQLAVDTCRQAGNEDIVLLKCTSAYPTPLNEVNAKTILDMSSRFNCLAGLSDHTLSSAAACAAVALGACVIEKHFILDASLDSPDASFSLDPKGLAAFIKDVREAEEVLGTVSYTLSDKAQKLRHFSRSLFVCEDVTKGEVITQKNVRSIRPGAGMHPQHLPQILGKTFSADVPKGTPLSESMIESDD